MKSKKLFIILLTAILIFPTFGCSEKLYIESTDYRVFYENFFYYDNFAQTEKAIKENEKMKQSYYFILNAEEYGDLDHGIYEAPRYSLYYDVIENGRYVNSKITVHHRFMYDPKMDKRKVGCVPRATGLPASSGTYDYYAYPTSNESFEFEFKHYKIINNSGWPGMDYLIQIYQSGKLVGSFYYRTEKINKKYYEKFIKENLILVKGGTALNEN